jgi:hypothetical protein
MRQLPLLLALAACREKDAPDTDPGDTDEPIEGATCAPGLTAADLAAGAWDPRFTLAGFAGHDGLAPAVQDFAVDADGSLVATGHFQWLGSERTTPLVRWRDGAWEPARETWELTPSLSGFSAVAISPDGDLALATYDDFGERSGEIWVDDGSGLRSVGAFDGLVRSLAWKGGQLWVAGNHQLDGIPGLAVWDGASWAAPPGGAVDGPVFELTIDGDELLVGGAFTSIGGIGAARVAAWDGEAWHAMDLPDGLAAYALARGDDGELYVGGAIADILSGVGGVARWDGAAWQLVGGGLSMYGWPGVVTDLVAHDGEIAATGCFSGAGGPEGAEETEPARALALWDGVSWRAADDGSSGVLGPWFQPGACGDEGLGTGLWDVSHQRLASDGETLFVGGDFPGAGGVSSVAIAGWADGAWQAQGEPGLGISGSIDELAGAGEGCDEVYGLGTFSHAGGDATGSRLVRFTGDGWTPIAEDLPADAWCPGLAASAGGDVAVGCMEFPADGGDTVGRIYRVAGDALEVVDAEVGPIHSLVYDADGVLWIAGGASTGFLARLDGDTLTVVEDGFDAPVTRVDVRSERDLVVGGMFQAVGDVAASRVARWDGEAWSPLGDGAPGMVTALARDGEAVYVSTYDEGGGAWLLGAWDGASWTELATPSAGLTPQPYFNFEHIEVIDGGLLVVGSATLDDGGRGALVYRDGAFAALGGGVGGIGISDLQLTSDAVWIAGTIAEVGSGATLAPSHGVARYALAP